MTWSNGYFSLTRILGIASFVASLALCGWRWRRCAEGDVFKTLFAALASVQAVLLLDMVFDWRWRLHSFWMMEAMQGGWYGQRRGPQLLVLLALGAVAGLSVALIVRRLGNRPGAALALLGTVLSAGLWCIEAISLHAVDGVLYTRVGGAMVVSFLWILLAVVTCTGIWMDGAGRA